MVWRRLDYQRIYASLDLNELNGTLLQTVQSNLTLVKPTLRNRVLSLVVWWDECKETQHPKLMLQLLAWILLMILQF